MPQTTIYLPNEVNEKLDHLAKRTGVSITELLSEAARQLAEQEPPPDPNRTPASHPPTRDLGPFKLPHEHWRELANEPGQSLP